MNEGMNEWKMKVEVEILFRREEWRWKTQNKFEKAWLKNIRNKPEIWNVKKKKNTKKKNKRKKIKRKKERDEWMNESGSENKILFASKELKIKENDRRKKNERLKAEVKFYSGTGNWIKKKEWMNEWMKRGSQNFICERRIKKKETHEKVNLKKSLFTSADINKTNMQTKKKENN